MNKHLFTSLIILTLWGCTTEEPSVSSFEDDGEFAFTGPSSVAEYFDLLGYDGSYLSETEKYFIVEDDIGFEKEKVLEDIRNYSNGRIEQHYTVNRLVDMSRYSTIFVKIDPSLNEYRTQVSRGLAQWNSIPNFGITFRGTRNDQYDILIRAAYNASDTGGGCGKMTIAGSGGNPGPEIAINVPRVELSAQTTDPNILKQHVERITVHELGHSIGFNHTNENIAGTVPVPGVGQTDALSIMNQGNCNPNNNVWAISAKDALAAQSLYPESSCYLSEWDFVHSTPSTVYDATTLTYDIREINSTFSSVLSNTPTLKVSSTQQIYTVYEGSWYLGVWNSWTYRFEVNIPLVATGNCATNPVRSARLRFHLVSSATSSSNVKVNLVSLSNGHQIRSNPTDIFTLRRR